MHKTAKAGVTGKSVAPNAPTIHRSALLNDQYDFASRMSLGELLVCGLHIVEWICMGDGHHQFTIGHHVGQFSQNRSTGCFGIAINLHSILGHRGKVDDGVDPIWRHTEFERQLHVSGSKRIDECIHAVRGRRPYAIQHAVTMNHGHHTQRTQVLLIRYASDANDGGPDVDCELYGQRPHPASRPGNHHCFPRAGVHGTDCGIRRGACHEKRGRHLPGNCHRFGGDLGSVNQYEAGLRTAIVGEADHVFADVPIFDSGTNVGDPPGKIAPLARRERGRPLLMKDPFANVYFAGVDGGGHHLHHHLARSWLRTLHLNHVQHVHSAVLTEFHCLRHGEAPLISWEKPSDAETDSVTRVCGVSLIFLAAEDMADTLRDAGIGRGSVLALTTSATTAALAAEGQSWSLNTNTTAVAVQAVEAALRPRWVWWSNHTASALTASGVRVATCWDISAVHRLLFGGWSAEPALVWARLHDLSVESIPVMGQLGLLDGYGDEGSNPENPVRPGGHLRPEWTHGGWSATPARLEVWATLALETCRLQQRRITALAGRNGAVATARSESAAELLCTELGFDGLPVDVDRAAEIIALSIGPRPRNDAELAEARTRRDAVVLSHVRVSAGMDLRNPTHVRSMLMGVGIDLVDTRAWRLEPFRTAHPLVNALMKWRKAEKVATTYGYTWLDTHVGADGRLRGAWTGSDGAGGRMTAQAGLHNLPTEMRDAVVAEYGHVFVHADLGQIEPRVLAAVSGDSALAAATTSDDLYAPVAARLGVERAVAKVAVLAAMYGQTSGTAGEALRGMESAYPVAMEFLRVADRMGQSAQDIRTYGGRLVRMGGRDNSSAVMAARGRFARNAVIQGAAAELFKAWAVTVRGRVAPFGARIVLCLHDELLLHVPAEHGAVVAQLLEASLADAAQRWMPDGAVRYVAHASVINRWSEAKG